MEIQWKASTFKWLKCACNGVDICPPPSYYSSCSYCPPSCSSCSPSALSFHLPYPDPPRERTQLHVVGRRQQDNVIMSVCLAMNLLHRHPARVFTVPNETAYGVLAARKFEANEPILPYSGKLLPNHEPPEDSCYVFSSHTMIFRGTPRERRHCVSTR